MSNGVLGAMGIGVSDLDRSVDFYRRVLGMEQIGKLRLPEMDEVLLGYNRSRGPALVLMHYTDGREVDRDAHGHDATCRRAGDPEPLRRSRTGQWSGQACAVSGYGLIADPPPGWISKCRCGPDSEALPELPT